MSTTPPPRPETMLAHGAFVRGIVRSLLRGDASEDDLVQQTLVRAWESGPRDPGRLRPWLATVARNLTFDHLRRRRRETRSQENDRPAAGAAPSPSEVLQREEDRGRVVRAVLALPEPYRGTVLLRFWDELPLAAIAQRLGLPAGTVRSRLHRGIAMLRERLDEEYGDRRGWQLALLPFVGGHPAELLAPVAAAAANSTPTAATATTGALLMTKLKTSLIAGGCALAAIATILVLTHDPEPTPTPGAPNGANPGAAMAAIDRGGPASATVTSKPAATANAADPVERVEAQAGALAVRGSVTHDGTPVPEFPIMLEWFEGPDTSAEPTSTHRLVSDANGRFEWAGEPRAAAATVRAVAAEQNAVVWCDPAVLDAGQLEVGLTVRILPLDRTLAGRVLDKDKQPVTGAQLTINGFPATLAESDQNGRYLLRAPSDGYPLLVTASGYRQRLIESFMPEGVAHHELDIELEPGAVFRGRVVDESGAPIVDANVRGSGLFGRGTRTAADGTFELDGASPGSRHQLAATKPGFQRGTTVAETGDDDVEITLVPGHDVTIRVVDTNGDAIVGASIHIVPEPHRGWLRRGNTGTDGRKVLADLASKPLDVIVEKPGYVRHRAPITPPEIRNDHTITLQVGRAIAGVVVDETGEPLAGVTVRCRRRDLPPERASVGERATTGPDGRFEVDGLPLAPCDVIGHRTDLGRTILEGVSGSPRGLRLVMQPAPAVAGRVVDGVTGDPIESFTVSLTANSDVQRLDLRPMEFTDPGGAFRIQQWQMQAGKELFVEVEAAGYARTRMTGSAVVNPAPDRLLVRMFHGSRLHGTLRDDRTGAPVANAAVMLHHSFNRILSPRRKAAAFTDDNGRFEITGVEAGRCSLSFRHDDYPPAVHGPVEVPEGDGELEIAPVIAPGVTLRGRVTGDGAAAGLVVHAMLPTGSSRKTTVGEDLTFEFDELGAGPHSLAVALGDRNRNVRLEIGTTDIDDFVLPLTTGSGSLRVEVRGLQEGGAQVKSLAEARTTDYLEFENGEFTVRGLAAGRYRVQVYGGGQRGTTEVEVGTTETFTTIECKR